MTDYEIAVRACASSPGQDIDAGGRGLLGLKG